jgi:hypothetical protein
MFRENNTLTSCIAHKVINNHEKGARVHSPHSEFAYDDAMSV